MFDKGFCVVGFLKYKFVYSQQRYGYFYGDQKRKIGTEKFLVD